MALLDAGSRGRPECNCNGLCGRFEAQPNRVEHSKEHRPCWTVLRMAP